MTEWYCLDCKKMTDVFPGIGILSPRCRSCKGPRVMKLEKMNKKEFNKFVKEFKNRTGELK